MSQVGTYRSCFTTKASSHTQCRRPVGIKRASPCGCTTKKNCLPTQRLPKKGIPCSQVFFLFPHVLAQLGNMLEVTIWMLQVNASRSDWQGQIAEESMMAKDDHDVDDGAQMIEFGWGEHKRRRRHAQCKDNKQCHNRNKESAFPSDASTNGADEGDVQQSCCVTAGNMRGRRAKRSGASHGLRKRKPQAAEQSDNGVHRARCEVQERKDQCLKERSWTVHRRQGFCHFERSL